MRCGRITSGQLAAKACRRRKAGLAGWLEMQISCATPPWPCRILNNPPRLMLVVIKFPLALCDRLAFRLFCHRSDVLDRAKGCRHKADLTSSPAHLVKTSYTPPYLGIRRFDDYATLSYILCPKQPHPETIDSSVPNSLCSLICHRQTPRR